MQKKSERENEREERVSLLHYYYYIMMMMMMMMKIHEFKFLFLRIIKFVERKQYILPKCLF